MQDENLIFFFWNLKFTIYFSSYNCSYSCCNSRHPPVTIPLEERLIGGFTLTWSSPKCQDWWCSSLQNTQHTYKEQPDVMHRLSKQFPVASVLFVAPSTFHLTLNSVRYILQPERQIAVLSHKWKYFCPLWKMLVWYHYLLHLCGVTKFLMLKKSILTRVVWANRRSTVLW